MNLSPCRFISLFTVMAMALAALAGCLPQAHAGLPILSVNFGSKLEMNPGEEAGFISASHWNNALGGVGRLSPLRDSSGNDTKASLVWTAGSGLQKARSVDENTPGNVRMMLEYLDSGPDTTTTVAVTGLAGIFGAGKYDVIVYFKGSPEGAFRLAEFSIGESTITAVDRRDVNFDGEFKEAVSNKGGEPGEGNCVRFRQLRGDSFLLTIKPGKSEDQWPRAPINGFQIVPSQP